MQRNEFKKNEMMKRALNVVKLTFRSKTRASYYACELPSK